MTSKSAAATSLFDWTIVRPALLDSLKKLSPRQVAKNPVMFVVEVGSVLVTLVWLRDLVAPSPGAAPAWFTAGRGRLALVHGDLRQLRRGGGRGARQGPGRGAAPDALRHPGPPPARRARGAGAGHGAAQGRPGGGRGRRGHPRRRRRHRGDRLGRRVGHHRRVGPGHPRVGRRPLRRHRRHQGALRPDRGPHLHQSRRVLPRPDDRPGRGRGAPEDAQRDRPPHPAGGADHHLPHRLRHAGADRRLLRDPPRR